MCDRRKHKHAVVDVANSGTAEEGVAKGSRLASAVAAARAGRAGGTASRCAGRVVFLSWFLRWALSIRAGPDSARHDTGLQDGVRFSLWDVSYDLDGMGENHCMPDAASVACAIAAADSTL